MPRASSRAAVRKPAKPAKPASSRPAAKAGRGSTHLAYMTFTKARALTRALGFSSIVEWKRWARTEKRPEGMPLHPDRYYSKGEGPWKSWQDFIGPRYGERRRRHAQLTYGAAKGLVRTQGLRSAVDFAIWARSDERPRGLPLNPAIAYRMRGWKGWSDFLGHAGDLLRAEQRGTQLHYLTFAAARQAVGELGLRHARDYAIALSAHRLPAGLPAKPDLIYASQWQGWPHFLGIGAGRQVRPGVKPAARRAALEPASFEQARVYVRKLKLPTINRWYVWAAGRQRPPYIPAEPWKAYLTQGYTTLEDFLGLPEPVSGRPEARKAMPRRKATPRRRRKP